MLGVQGDQISGGYYRRECINSGMDHWNGGMVE